MPALACTYLTQNLHLPALILHLSYTVFALCLHLPTLTA